MWPAMIFVYAVGVAVTAATVFRNRVFGQAYLVNAGAVVLWPLYWGFFLVTLIANRQR